eukprot:3966609-Amphidinium_carterae.1
MRETKPKAADLPTPEKESRTSVLSAYTKNTHSDKTMGLLRRVLFPVDAFHRTTLAVQVTTLLLLDGLRKVKTESLNKAAGATLR